MIIDTEELLTQDSLLKILDLLRVPMSRQWLHTKMKEQKMYRPDLTIGGRVPNFYSIQKVRAIALERFRVRGINIEGKFTRHDKYSKNCFVGRDFASLPADEFLKDMQNKLYTKGICKPKKGLKLVDCIDCVIAYVLEEQNAKNRVK